MRGSELLLFRYPESGRKLLFPDRESGGNGGFLRCVAGAVVRATLQAQKDYPGLRVVFSGGVASNSLLREQTKPLNPVFAEPRFSTDNAMGVALLASRLTEVGYG